MLGETVDVYRPTVAGGNYGDDTITFPSTPSHSVDGVAVAPGSTSEVLVGRSAVLVGMTLYMPPGADVEATDRLGVRGLMYEADGDLGTWVNPHNGIEAGRELAVSRVDG